MNFSECKKLFFPVFWRTRNDWLNDGQNIDVAEWFATGEAIHQTLQTLKMSIAENGQFVKAINAYLLKNNCLMSEFALLNTNKSDRKMKKA